MQNIINHNLIESETVDVEKLPIYYEKKKREQEDFCNICGKKRILTWDHVPPRSLGNDYIIKANSWVNGFPIDDKYDHQFQNGIKFRSICSECNNSVLGASYDKEYKKFANEISKLINTKVTIPEITHISINANKLCRSICGHFLASKNYFDSQTLIDKELRKYVLNQNERPPKRMKLLFWVYPYSSILIIRDSTVSAVGKKYDAPDGVISVMNFYPVALILTSGKKNCGLSDLFSYCTNNIEDVINVPVDCKSFMYPNSKHQRPPLWPCEVTDDDDGVSFLMTTENVIKDSYVANLTKRFKKM